MIDTEIFQDPRAYALGLPLAGLFILMVWKIPTWASYPLSYKIILTVAILPLSVLVAGWKLNQ